MPREVREEFLRKLRGLLGAGRARSARVLEEIEDHLAAQQEELVGLGMEHDEAWRRVVEEFGDVDDFVGSEHRLNNQRKWRWMMRYTTLTILGTFAVIVGVMAMAPEHGRLRPSVSVAQEATELEQQGPGVPAVSPVENNTWNEEVRAKMRERIPVDLVDHRVAEILEFIGQEQGIDFIVDPDCGLTLEELDTVKSYRFRSIRISMLLDLVLAEHGLTVSVVDGLAMIHDQTGSRWDQTVRVYNVTNLLENLELNGGPATDPHGHDAPGVMGSYRGASNNEPVQRSRSTWVGQTEVGASGEKFAWTQIGGMGMGGMSGGMVDEFGQAISRPSTPIDELITVIEATIEPESWHNLGGPNSISGLNGLVVVRGPERVHSQIDLLLEQMAAAIE